MEKQLSLIKEENTLKTCVFTGHRELGADFSPHKLKKTIEELVKAGVDTFYNGGAVGFDLIAAKQTLILKKKYPQIKLVLCVPYYGQEKRYLEEDKKTYAEICKKADEVNVLYEHYFRGCMLARDRYMVDRADVMIAYLKKTTGGTAYTVSYFQKKAPNGEIFYI